MPPRKKRPAEAKTTPYRPSEPTNAPQPIPEHPYDWVVADMGAVERRFRQENGHVSPEIIDAHLAECWRTGAHPVIKGVTIGQRVSE